MCRPLNKVKTIKERVFFGLWRCFFFLCCWCTCALCDSTVVATFTWLQLFFLISDIFFLSYLPSYTACGKNLQMWITSNIPTLFVVQISASF